MKNPESSSQTSPQAGAPQSWRPSYWKEEHGTAWDNVREAFSRDWEQTKTDVTGKGPDLNQDVPNTVKQAFGSEPIPQKGAPNAERKTPWNEAEPGVRYGFGARQQYGKDIPEWSDTLERRLETEWDAEKTGTPFRKVHRFVRAGWDRNKKE